MGKIVFFQNKFVRLIHGCGLYSLKTVYCLSFIIILPIIYYYIAYHLLLYCLSFIIILPIIYYYIAYHLLLYCLSFIIILPIIYYYIAYHLLLFFFFSSTQILNILFNRKR